MGIKHTTESFIEKANKTHSGIYDYTLVNYKGSFEKIKIVSIVLFVNSIESSFIATS